MTERQRELYPDISPWVATIESFRGRSSLLLKINGAVTPGREGTHSFSAISAVTRGELLETFGRMGDRKAQGLNEIRNKILKPVMKF